MVPVAISLGLKPFGIKDMPARVRGDVFTKEHGLQGATIYAGYGHFSHRLSPTKWENPFRVGKHGAPADVVFQFLANWDNSGLSSHLSELTGKKLACDCPDNKPCHVDVIMATWLEHRQHTPQRTKVRGTGLRQVLVAAMRVVHAVPQAFSQSAVMSSLMSLFLE